jgi:hypothetical protein
VICDLEQKSLLRVCRLGLTRGDAEELGIEPIDLIEKAAPARIHSSRLGGIRVIHRREVPPLCGNLDNGVNAADEQVP